jgi:hypothetical protein
MMMVWMGRTALRLCRARGGLEGEREQRARLKQDEREREERNFRGTERNDEIQPNESRRQKHLR